MHLLESSNQSPLTNVCADDYSNQLRSASGIGYDSNREGTTASATEVSMPSLTLRKSPSTTKVASTQISTSSTTKTPISKLHNYDSQKKSDTAKNKNRPSSSSISSSSNGASVNPTSSSVIKSKDKGPTENHSRESIDFVRQISEFLTIDGIKSVVDKIHIALDKEKEELIMRMKQLEHKMEGDCEVIITCRSSNSSTPRLSEKLTSTNNNHSIESNSNSISCSPGGSRVESKGSSGSSVGSRSINNSSDSDIRIGLGSHKVPGACEMCGARLTSHTEVVEDQKASRGQATSSSSSSSSINKNDNNSSSSSSSGIRGKSKTDHGVGIDGKVGIRVQEKVFQCVDCKLKKRRERIIGNRPLSEKSLSDTTSSSPPPARQKGDIDRKGNDKGGSDTFMDGDFDSISALPSNSSKNVDSSKNGSKVDNNPSSKFRNRLQAARDEHHFIADDHFLR